MRVEFLGTGGFHPNERRHTACILVPELGVAFDAGSSLFRLPGRARTPVLDIFLSHSHLDHVCGLTNLLVPVINGQFEGITVYGAERTLNAVRTHLFAEEIFPVDPSFAMQALPGAGAMKVRNAEIRWQPLAGHPGGSMTFRLNWQTDSGEAKSLSYVTDTTVDGTYTEFIRASDLLIHECYFADGVEGLAARTGHSYSSQVARLAQDAGVKRLILTHLDPYNHSDDPLGIDGMKAIFPNVQVAADGMVVEV